MGSNDAVLVAHRVGEPMISVADSIARYYKAGLRPVLLWGLLDGGVCACTDPDCNGSSGKHPISTEWQATRPNLTMLVKIAEKRPCNVGLAMGEQPRGDFLVAVDCDGPDSLLAELEERVACKLPHTLTSATSKGTHRIYSVAGGVVIGNRAKLLKAPKGAPDIDIRGAGGQIVAPPSKHRSGHVYYWINRPPIAELPLAFVDWLTEEQLPSRPAPIPCVMRWRTLDAFERAQKYVQKCAPAVSGSSGHQTTFETCIKLVRSFPELSEAQLWSLLVEYNETCVPPWSERDLRHKLQDAIRGRR